MDQQNAPQHIAIIPDGNRRWATEQGKEPWDGHYAGAERIEQLAEHAYDAGVRCLTFWGSSLANMTKRPATERAALLDVYQTYFDKLIASEELVKKDIRINVLGRWREQLPQTLCDTLERGIEQTKKHSTHMLNFLIAYSGTDEMLGAVKSLVASGVAEKDIDEQQLKRALMTRDMPPVDLVIRTGGEPHNSAGFMMWDTAEAQLYFSEKYFPDFDQSAFNQALQEYARRTRRLGA